MEKDKTHLAIGNRTQDKCGTTRIPEMKAERLIEKAKVQLVLHHPFFASTILRRKIEIVESPGFTACVDLSGKIRFGREWLEKLTLQQTIFVMAHETMHYVLLHFLRTKWRDPRTANHYMDQVINDILEASGVGDPPEEGVYREDAREFAWEQLYEKNEDRMEPGSGGDYQPGSGLDDLSGEGAPEKIETLIDEIRSELAQAVQVAKSCGKVPAGLDRLIEDIINPATPWYHLLERWMTGYVKADITWAKPRKNMLAVAYFPSQNRHPSMGTLAIIADSSGSISQEIPHFVGHLNKIMESCAPEKVYFLHVDAKVHQVDEFTEDDLPIRIKSIKGGGGTDMGAGLLWLQEKGIDVDACIVLTDGYTPWPEKAPLFPLAILCTTDQAVPYGELIKYDLNDKR